jgi:hypothetical protein
MRYLVSLAGRVRLPDHRRIGRRSSVCAARAPPCAGSPPRSTKERYVRAAARPGGWSRLPESSSRPPSKATTSSTQPTAPASAAGVDQGHNSSPPPTTPLGAPERLTVGVLPAPPKLERRVNYIGISRLPDLHVLNRYHFGALWRCFSDVTGRSRHWMSNVDYTTRKRRPGQNRKRRLDGELCCVLPRDLVRAFAVRALGRFDLLASFAAQDAGKAPHPWPASSMRSPRPSYWRDPLSVCRPS